MCWRDSYIPIETFDGQNMPGMLAHRLNDERKRMERLYEGLSIEDLERVVSGYKVKEKLNERESEQYNISRIVLSKKLELRSPF